LILIVRYEKELEPQTSHGHIVTTAAARAGLLRFGKEASQRAERQMPFFHSDKTAHKACRRGGVVVAAVETAPTLRHLHVRRSR
jgi:hypothetical protein